MEARFTWNTAKAVRNRRVHGISFELAREVFAAPPVVVTENYHFEGEEQRYLAIGMTLDVTLVVVVFVDRSQPDCEVIHIVSARKAEEYEREIYEAQIG